VGLFILPEGGTMDKKHIEIRELQQRLGSQRTRAIAAVGSEIRICAGTFLRKQGFVEINPVIISPLTDPLHHETLDGSISYLDHRYQLTRSMIFHKHIALLGLEKIFIFSPNIRLEPPRYAVTKKHLIEFTQIDVEIRNGTREDAIDLVENMVIEILNHVRDHCSQELTYLERSVTIPKKPFRCIKYLDAQREHGVDFESHLSADAREPFWIIDFPIEAREFYDREYKNQPGILCDMDLVYPEGYGEASSGGEREYTYERIIERISKTDLHPHDYGWYLELAKSGLPPCAGFGIGVERLTRYICGLSDIAEATIFPKIPGTWTI
jgi:asparaginyl-tRNA synthetase